MTARVSREGKKIQPRNFAITVNGLAIFAMGADYIPEDSILTRQSRERTDLLLSSAKEAHHNCMRIWGGGYFCDDAVYDLCDEKGILVWQDMMFSCAAYELDAAFEKNISLEIRQNIRRLRSHPCLALWCGNNEMETQYETWDWPKTKKQYYDYIRLFECLIPDMVRPTGRRLHLPEETLRTATRRTRGTPTTGASGTAMSRLPLTGVIITGSFRSSASSPSPRCRRSDALPCRRTGTSSPASWRCTSETARPTERS